MKLFLSGSKTEFSRGGLRKSVPKIQDFLDKSKEGELFNSLQIMSSTKLSRSAVNEAALCLTKYALKVGSKRYWGRPTTISQLVKELKK